jgi:2-oxoglutarate ferredoxin oxidoreductase subunit gamma
MTQMPEKNVEKAVRHEIRLAGSGGQGIIMAAIVLAEAAGVHEGKQVSQTQSYGPEARGGTCKAEVVISDVPIDYPKVSRPDFLLAMNQASVNTYFGDLKPTGLLIVDSTLVSKVPTAKTVSIPFTQIARDEFGTDLVANMVALGALGFLSKDVSQESLEDLPGAARHGGAQPQGPAGGDQGSRKLRSEETAADRCGRRRIAAKGCVVQGTGLVLLPASFNRR